MKRTFRLRKKNFNFDKKGMILKGVVASDGQRIFVRAWDIYLNNKDIMSDEEVEICFINGSEYIWCYKTKELEPLEVIKITQLDYEMLKFVQKQDAKYICRDKNGVLNLFENEPYIISECDSWYVKGKGKRDYFGNFANQLFQFATWESQKYYVIEDVLNNYEVVEDD